MGSAALSNRDNWQRSAAVTGKKGEDGFAAAIAAQLSSHYTVVNKPAKINLYSGGKGVKLDTYVINNITKKSILVEVKSGENGGNAHERAYKYLSEGMRNALRNKNPSLVSEAVFFVFSGRTFSGEQAFCSSSGNKVHPQKYRDEFAITIPAYLYSVSDSSFLNIEDIAKKIMNLLEQSS